MKKASSLLLATFSAIGTLEQSALCCSAYVFSPLEDSARLSRALHSQSRPWRQPCSQQPQPLLTARSLSTISSSRCNNDCVIPNSNRANNEPPLKQPLWKQFETTAKHMAAAGLLASVLFFSSSPALAENELSAKYGGGLDTSLVDQTCLVDHCSLQAKACLADDPECRKGLTCTAKCLGDNACITGCMARYGDEHLDQLLKCTIEDHECIKVAILDGGADAYGSEPKSPAPTLRNFDPKSLEGSWYKVVGYNPNYDCYACQRNTFSAPQRSGANNPLFVAASNNNINNNHHHHQSTLTMDVEFSMPHLLPDGSPPPPSNVRELIRTAQDGTVFGTSQSIGLNDYNTRETMVFDTVPNNDYHRHHPWETKLVLNPGSEQEQSFARTAHSEGEMFGLSKCQRVKSSDDERVGALMWCQPSSWLTPLLLLLLSSSSCLF